MEVLRKGAHAGGTMGVLHAAGIRAAHTLLLPSEYRVALSCDSSFNVNVSVVVCCVEWMKICS